MGKYVSAVSTQNTPLSSSFLDLATVSHFSEWNGITCIDPIVNDHPAGAITNLYSVQKKRRRFVHGTRLSFFFFSGEQAQKKRGRQNELVNANCPKRRPIAELFCSLSFGSLQRSCLPTPTKQATVHMIEIRTPSQVALPPSPPPHSSLSASNRSTHQARRCSA